MRTCASCGFENAEEGRACALCGASEVRTLLGVEETLALPPGRAAPVPVGNARLGEVWADRFRLEELLGRGGMGQVFRVRDLESGEDRALKVLLPVAEPDPDRAERFKREIGILARLSHPAILQILAFGIRGDELFFVSELVQGADLKSEIRRRGPWPAAEAAALAATLADALGAAHAQGIVHRDVKPNNVMITRDGAVRLLDFGLARGVGIDMATLTRTGAIVGTPGYMSPEQFDGHADERSDLYSLGIILYQMAAGRRPFEGETVNELMHQHLKVAAPSPKKWDPELPDGLCAVIRKLIAKAPKKRYAKAPDLLADLKKVVGGEDPDAMAEFGAMVKCGFCEALNAVTEKKCRICGERLHGAGGPIEIMASPLDEVKCPGCGRPNPKGTLMCKHCGKPWCVRCKRRLAVLEGLCHHCMGADRRR